MTARDVIAQALALSEAATDGPWIAGGSVNDTTFPDSAGHWGDQGIRIGPYALRDMPTAADATFTAAARTLLPALAKALGDVLDVADGHDQRADQAGRLDFDPTQSGMATAHRLAARGIRAAITAALSEVTP